MPFEQPIPRPFSSTEIQTYAPALPGVYGISNAREWIYIGTADNVRDALMAHLEDRDAAIMMRHPTGFVFEACSPWQRPIRQDRLVLEYEPTCNRHSPRYH